MKGTAIITTLLALGLSLGIQAQAPALPAVPAAANQIAAALPQEKQQGTALPAGDAAQTVPTVSQEKTVGQADTEKKEEETKGKDKKEKRKAAHVPTQADEQWLRSLDTLNIEPLTTRDFYIGSIYTGDGQDKVKRVFGAPSKYSRSMHYTHFQYDDAKYNLHFIFLNDNAASLRSESDTREAIHPGIETIYLTSGQNILIGRDVRLKYPTEVLVRQLGLPTSVLRDADANVYYFIYSSPNKKDMYVFAIGNRHVERVALMPVRPPYINGDELAPGDRKLDEHDFTLMGFALDKPFQANKYNMWNSLVKHNGSNFWLYGDYGVEVDRHNQVKKVFLLTNNAYTGRGATLGYHISTILALYGWPDRVERGPEKKKSVDALYYDSPYQKGVSLVIVLKHDDPYVDDIILTDSPIANLQDPVQRYGLK